MRNKKGACTGNALRTGPGTYSFPITKASAFTVTISHLFCMKCYVEFLLHFTLKKWKRKYDILM